MGISLKKVVLCADDFGLNTAVSHGIIQLIKDQKISATSCMVRNPYWEENAQLLKPYLKQVDVGLHFDLPKYPKLYQLILKANLRLLNKKLIAQEFEQQLTLFEHTLGKLPDFIDGHQHIHQLPVISDAIFEVYNRLLTKTKPYIRYVTSNLLTAPCPAKQLIIKAVTSFAFQKKLKKYAIPHNTSFSGIYNFGDSENYYTYFPKFLKAVTNNSYGYGLVMCHPALNRIEDDDPIANSRYDEMQYFSSHQFICDCQNENVTISRMANRHSAN
jgi:predicted glycoside hydrolase/deacetylase ChbG (UPF0249 family)